jgi:hypothetical protein
MRSDGIRAGVVGVSYRGSRNVCVLRSAWRRSSASISGSPKSMMDNSRPIRGVVVSAGLDDVTVQPELCYGGASAGEGRGQW